MISIFEVRTLLPQAKVEEEGRMKPPIYGVMAEFDNPTALVNAARRAREEGYRKLDDGFARDGFGDKSKVSFLLPLDGIIYTRSHANN